MKMTECAIIATKKLYNKNVAYVREIRYIHQGSTNGIGWQAYIYTKDGDIKILKESIDKKVIIEYTTNYNE